MTPVLLALSCLVLAAAGQPFFPFPGFGSSGNLFDSPFFSGGDALSPIAARVPVLGSSLSSAALFAQSGLSSAASFGQAGLSSLQSGLNNIPRGSISSSFTSSSSSQNGAEPAKTVSNSFSSISKIKA